MKIQLDDYFDLDKIANSGQCFRWKLLEDGKSYLIIDADDYVIARQESSTLILSCDQFDFDRKWKHYFDLDTPVSYMDMTKSMLNPPSDPFLSKCIVYGKGIRILNQSFEDIFISFLISQRKNIPAIQKCIENLCEKFGNKIWVKDLNTYIHTFPDFDRFFCICCPKYSNEYSDYCKKVDKNFYENINVDNRRDKIQNSYVRYYLMDKDKDCSFNKERKECNCGLGYRIPYIVNSSYTLFSQGKGFEELNKLSDEELMSTLTSLYGIGPKIANCISLYAFHRLNNFPIDVWIQRILDKFYPNGYDMKKYSPYNGLAQQYMYYYIQNHPEELKD